MAVFVNIRGRGIVLASPPTGRRENKTKRVGGATAKRVTSPSETVFPVRSNVTFYWNDDTTSRLASYNSTTRSLNVMAFPREVRLLLKSLGSGAQKKRSVFQAEGDFEFHSTNYNKYLDSLAKKKLQYNKENVKFFSKLTS